MVRGDDNSSLPHMAFVSHSPYCLGVLVLISLLTLSSQFGHATNLAHAPVLETGCESLPLDAFAEEVPSPSARFESAAQQSPPFRAAMFRRDPWVLEQHREALSQAWLGGDFAAGKADLETIHRFARLTGRQRSRGGFSRGPDPTEERLPFVAWKGFPPTLRAS